MPEFDVTYKYKIVPRGVWVKLSHHEACYLHEIGDAINDVKNFLDLPKVVAEMLDEVLSLNPYTAVAKVLINKIDSINYWNRRSGGNGVKLFFNFGTILVKGMYAPKVHRRRLPHKWGSSPCK
jgi:hypothetical protein